MVQAILHDTPDDVFTCLNKLRGFGPFVTEHVLVSSLVHHVMNQGPYHVQFGGGWHTIPLDPAVFGDRGRCDTARHLCPLCGHMSLRWEIYNVDNGRIWIRCTRFRRHGCTFQWYPPSNFWRSVRIQRRPQIPQGVSHLTLELDRSVDRNDDGILFHQPISGAMAAMASHHVAKLWR